MGTFEKIEESGARVISGSSDAKCWAYGVLHTGEIFNFECWRKSASLKIQTTTKLRFITQSFEWKYEFDEGEDNDTQLWPSESDVIAHFSRLHEMFLLSGHAGVFCEPMSDEEFDKLRAAELSDLAR